MNWLRNVTSMLWVQSQNSVMKTTVRYKTVENIRRFKYRQGYTPYIFEGGCLPRHKNANRIKSLPIYAPKNNWSTKRAIFGQNDYIDILGDERIKPIQLQTQIPSWLRGFRGNEFQMLLRKRAYHKHWQKLKPTKWHDLKKRIEYLYRFLNRRTKTGPPKRIGYDC